jgi:hypothetical protein
MKKVRVAEIAKDYGMKGPGLAKLLRNLGFDNIKTHMTVLDDTDLMQVEARLSARGVKKQMWTSDSDIASHPEKGHWPAVTAATRPLPTASETPPDVAFRLGIESGDATPAEIAELLACLGDLYRAHGGLDFRSSLMMDTSLRARSSNDRAHRWCARAAGVRREAGQRRAANRD